MLERIKAFIMSLVEFGEVDESAIVSSHIEYIKERKAKLIAKHDRKLILINAEIKALELEFEAIR